MVTKKCFSCGWLQKVKSVNDSFICHNCSYHNKGKNKLSDMHLSSQFMPSRNDRLKDKIESLEKQGIPFWEARVKEDKNNKEYKKQLKLARLDLIKAKKELKS